jgi:cell division septation protein DedD
MPFEVSHPRCPLCKRQVPESVPEHTLSTRLCEQCQTLVLTASGGRDSIVAARTAVAPLTGARADVLRDAPVSSDLMAGEPELFEGLLASAPYKHEAQSLAPFDPADSSNIEFYTDEESDRLVGDAPGLMDGNSTYSELGHELRSPIPFDTPDLARFDFYGDEDADHFSPVVERGQSAASENGTSRHGEELSEGFAQFIAATSHESAEAEESHLRGQPSETTMSAVDADHTGGGAYPSEGVAGPGWDAATDPWEAPLPAWDYSQNEWPVLVGPSRQETSRKRIYGIATIGLLACVSIYYFLIYRPSTPQARAATESGTTARVSAAATGAPAPEPADSAVLARTAPTPSDTGEGAASPQAETVASVSTAPNDDGAKGRFSLQAAAFPTAVGAGELAEKLKRAGLPSYVVSADISRRGRWFRVRVGRFNSAEEAQSFAAEAQRSARATGLTVQLIVCQYDQP